MPPMQPEKLSQQEMPFRIWYPSIRTKGLPARFHNQQRKAMMNHFTLLPHTNHSDENLFRFHLQLQAHIQELMNAGSAIPGEVDKINAIILAVQDLLTSDPGTHSYAEEITSPQKKIRDPYLFSQDTIHSLEEILTSFAIQYRQIVRRFTEILPDILPPDLDDDNLERLRTPDNIPKIPIYLIYKGIYTLTRVIRTIRVYKISMPGILMEDTYSEFGYMAGLDGTVNKECPLSGILKLFLIGQSYRVNNQAREFQKITVGK